MNYAPKKISSQQEKASSSKAISTFTDRRESTQVQLNQQGMMKSVTQRALIPYKPKTDTTSEEKIATLYAAVVDEMVIAAYEEFMSGNYAGASDAQIALYKLRKHEFDEARRTGSGYTMHPSTAAGYVIEGKANNKIMAALSNVQLQVTDMLDGTRPDIAFKINETKYWGLVDITASNSAGHIFSKKGNWTNHEDIIHVSEAVYPSINFDNMAPIVLTELDIQQIESKAKEKEILKQEEFDYWRDLYAEVQNNVLRSLTSFNQNNITNFTGTSSQLLRIIGYFRKVGLGLMIYPNSTQLVDVTEILFEDQDGTNQKNKTPYKVDLNFTKGVIERLNTNNMTELVK